MHTQHAFIYARFGEAFGGGPPVGGVDAAPAIPNEVFNAVAEKRKRLGSAWCKESCVACVCRYIAREKKSYS